jgi:hypothetical protein
MAAWSQAAYCTSAQVQAFARALREDWTVTATADAITLLIQAASDLVDDFTKTWWDSRKAKLTYTGAPDSRFLFLPAPIITLTSVVENTKTLTDGTEFWSKLDTLEKNDAYLWPVDQAKGVGWWWCTIPKSIVVQGTFGRATPSKIKLLTAAMAAEMGDLRRRQIIDSDGMLKEVTINQFSAWIQTALKRNRSVMIHGNEPPLVEYVA